VTAEETGVDRNDRDLLTKIVTVAEEVGKQVYPSFFPRTTRFMPSRLPARDLKANEVVLASAKK